jgi:DNA-binding ferritin-like protein (Dps family)
MAIGWIEQITGSLEQKKHYRQYKARVEQLPANYRTAIEALERYLMYFGAITKGDILVSMLEDLAELFEQSAANRTPIRTVVGEDPVEFAETFLQNYAEGQWINKERKRLTDAIDRVAGSEPQQEGERIWTSR